MKNLIHFLHFLNKFCTSVNCVQKFKKILDLSSITVNSKVFKLQKLTRKSNAISSQLQLARKQEYLPVLCTFTTILVMLQKFFLEKKWLRGYKYGSVVEHSFTRPWVPSSAEGRKERRRKGNLCFMFPQKCC